MLSRLSGQVINKPARMTVQVLLNMRDDPSKIDLSALSQDARMLFHRRLELQRQSQPAPKSTELKDYARELSSLFIENYSQFIMQDLTYATRVKLALIFWHFDDDPALVRGFLRSPRNRKVWESLHADYLKYSQQNIYYLEFIQSFDFLLLPRLPKLLYGLLSGDSGHHPPRTLAKHRQYRYPGSIRRLQSNGLQSNGLQSLPCPGPDASARPTLPPFHEVLKLVGFEFQNGTLERHFKSRKTCDSDKILSKTHSRITLGDQEILR